MDGFPITALHDSFAYGFAIGELISHLRSTHMVAYTMVAHFYGRTRHVHHDVLSRNTRGLELEMVILGMPKELYEVMYRMVQSLLKFIKKRKQKCGDTPGSYC